MRRRRGLEQVRFWGSCTGKRFRIQIPEGSRGSLTYHSRVHPINGSFNAGCLEITHINGWVGWTLIFDQLKGFWDSEGSGVTHRIQIHRVDGDDVGVHQIVASVLQLDLQITSSCIATLTLLQKRFGDSLKMMRSVAG